MRSDNWPKVKDIVADVLEMASGERAAYLDSLNLTGETRNEIETLIGFETSAQDLMSFSAVEFSKDLFDIGDKAEGKTIGVYRIIGELGHGGMGVVYFAERIDGKFEQRVALKVLKQEMNTTILRRHFEMEREILASLEHSNIARLLDAGTTENNIPYIAMEYVDGMPIDRYCHENGLSVEQRLDLFKEVCEAVDYAHRNLVVHRDLKPSNVLVTNDGIPKLLDFGISKIVDSSLETADSATITRLGVMTPSYASPEQISKKPVTTSSDIYSLGVLLYELLSGVRPFQHLEDDFAKAYQAVIDTDPKPPSNPPVVVSADKGIQMPDNAVGLETNPQSSAKTRKNARSIDPNTLKGDLDNIVLKALRKEPERRYASVNNFAEDIDRHLRGLTVSARPNTFTYRAEKFVKRNKGMVTVAALLAIALIGGLTATIWQGRVAAAERTKAENRFNDVRTLANSFIIDFEPLIENLPGSTPARRLLVTRALEYLDKISQESGDDKELRAELATAYEKVADVQGNPEKPNLGDTKGALSGYEKARAIRHELLKADPNNTDQLGALAENLNITSNIQLNSGEHALAKSGFDEAIEIARRLYQADPTNSEKGLKLVSIMRNSASVPFYQSDFAEALEISKQTKNEIDKVIVNDPTNIRLRALQYNLKVDIGETTGWLEDYKGASVLLEEALADFKQLVAENPNDHRIRRSLMVAFMKRGENLADLGEFDRSIANYGEAIDLVNQSIKIDPKNFQTRREIVIAHKQRANVYKMAGRAADAAKEFQIAYDHLKDLKLTDPENLLVTLDAANTGYAVGENLLTAGDTAGAVRELTTSIGYADEVINEDPSRVQAVRIRAHIYEARARAFAKNFDASASAAEKEKALADFKTALEVYTKLEAEGRSTGYDNTAKARAEKEIARLSQ